MTCTDLASMHSCEALVWLAGLGTVNFYWRGDFAGLAGLKLKILQ